ncbi:SEC-C metal-binding domain-containing protein [Aneurinibacillus tyrosinisolvens]|uniref:SEC-C metal-binding domain-containing protein n=1 Tax=Aneurinibacillus tyrosinisolvens TaxID=1443435 RepID=UPI0009E1FFFF|nr:SEC-C metal-binding domain-containing protein [Aneurinibacillus tyrosinisolvens]
MFSLGTEQRPIIVKVQSEKKGEKVALICKRFGWHYIIGLEYTEDLTDLRKALKDTLGPANVYDPCLCDSGLKYKFCCARKMKNFDIDQYVEEFDSQS